MLGLVQLVVDLLEYLVLAVFIVCLYIDGTGVEERGIVERWG